MSYDRDYKQTNKQSEIFTLYNIYVNFLPVVVLHFYILNIYRYIHITLYVKNFII